MVTALRLSYDQAVATLCSVIALSHSPYLYASPRDWELTRQTRAASGGIGAHVAVDSAEENEAKHARCERAFAILRDKLAAARPDVIIIFGDDQLEQFTFANFPMLGVFAGAAFSGYKISRYFGLPTRGERTTRPATSEHWAHASGHPPLARELLTGLVAAGFDPAISLEMPNPAAGMGHAFMRPMHSLTEYDIPVVPFFINCYYGPQPTGRRCADLGRAVRDVIEAWSEDVRVAVIGSGGLWHMPMAPGSDVDESFDAEILSGLTAGDADRMATYFDSRAPDVDPGDAGSLARASGGTGMVLGYGGGTGETRTWIAAAAAAGRRPGRVVDAFSINASPIGVAFAYWDMP
jgi:hypothetical protein